jgi:hypothetical protein
VEHTDLTTTESTSPLVRWTLALEGASALDGAVRAVEPYVRSAFATGARGAALRGDWLGHALHPPMTDLVLGTWTSATVLDLFGGEDSRGSAQTLVGAGLLAAGPTAWTGWAQWVEADDRDKRVGLVHAVSNAVAIGAYAASWMARRRGNHGSGATLALAGAAVSGLGAYLGGHLVAARKVATHHPAFDE